MKNRDVFEDTEGNKYHLKVSGGTESIFFCQGDDKNVLIELDYTNAYKLFDFLESSIEVLDQELTIE